MSIAAGLVLALTVSASTQEAHDVTSAQEAASQGKGIQQFKDGELDQALLTFDALVMDLRTAGVNADLVQALVWRGATLVGLGNEELARRSFREAISIDPALKLAKEEFPDRVRRVFDATRSGKTQSVMERPGTAPKKAGIGAATIGLIAGGVALAGGAAVTVAGGSGGNPNPTPATTTPAANRAPTSLTIDFFPGNGDGNKAIYGATVVTMTGNAVDPDGDSLTYSWQTRDGATYTGKEVRHVFGSEPDVTLTVRDARGSSATTTANVKVGRLSGTWRYQGDSATLIVDQGGPSISVQFRRPGSNPGSGGGRISDPRTVEFSFNYTNPLGQTLPGFRYSLTVDGSLERMSGTETSLRAGGPSGPITLLR